MPRLAWLQGTASFTPTGSEPTRLRADAWIDMDPPPPSWLLAETALVEGVADALRPRNGSTQIVALSLLADCPPTPAVLLDGEFRSVVSVEEGVDSGFSWSFGVPAQIEGGARHPLGYEVDWQAPPPGLSDLFMTLTYGLPNDQAVDYPLFSYGLSGASARTYGRRGHVMGLDGLGPEGRYDRSKVTLQLPAGHGWTHGEIIRELAAQAGIPEERIGVPADLGAPRLRALDIQGEEWGNAADEAAIALGYFLGFDRTGILVAMNGMPREEPEWVFTADQLAAATDLEAVAESEVPTCIVVTGEQPLIYDPFGGVVTTIETVEAFGPFALPRAYYYQEDDGSLVYRGDGYAGPAPSVWSLISRTTTLRRERHGCLIEEEIIEEGWMAPECVRYYLQADGSQDCNLLNQAFIYDSGASAFGSEPAYYWPQHRFVEKARTITKWEYNFLTFLLDKKTIWKWAWFNPQVPLKERTVSSDDWADIPFIANTRQTGRGTGVVLDTEMYFCGYTFSWGDGELVLRNDAQPLNGVDPIQLRVNRARSGELSRYFGTGGYLKREEAEVYDWIISTGQYWLYQGEEVSDLDRMHGRRSQNKLTTYSARGSRGLVTVENSFGLDGELVGQNIIRGQGSLPPHPRCDISDENRLRSRPWEQILCFGLESHPPNDQNASNDFLENEGEAMVYARSILGRAQAITVTMTLPVNAAIRRGMPAAIEIPEAGLSGPGWIESATIARSERNGALLSTVVFKLLPQGI